jgi:hypothetical protein
VGYGVADEWTGNSASTIERSSKPPTQPLENAISAARPSEVQGVAALLPEFML